MKVSGLPCTNCMLKVIVSFQIVLDLIFGQIWFQGLYLERKGLKKKNYYMNCLGDYKRLLFCFHTFGVRRPK